MRRIALVGLCFVLIAPLWATSAAASGGGGYGGGFEGRRNHQSSPSRTDPAYERGKKVAGGRARSARGLEICVAVAPDADDADEERIAKRLSARTLRPYKRTSTEAVASALVDCEDAAQPVSTVLTAQEFADLMHYLNRRYKLRL